MNQGPYLEIRHTFFMIKNFPRILGGLFEMGKSGIVIGKTGPVQNLHNVSEEPKRSVSIELTKSLSSIDKNR